MSLLAAAVVASGCGSSDSSDSGSGGAASGGLPDKIVIGVDGPLSGQVAAVGQSVENSVKLYVDQLGSDPTFSKIKIEVLSEDDQAQDQAAVNAVSKLLSSNIDALIGPDQSSAFLAAMPVVERAGVPMLSPVAAAGPAILQKGDPWIFLTTADAVKQAEALSDAIAAAGVKRVAILYSNDDYGAAGNQFLGKDLPGAGVKVVSSGGYPMTTQDFTTNVAKALAAKPDAVVVWGRQADSAAIVKLLGDYKGRIYGASGLTSPAFPKLAGEAANDVQFPTTFVQTTGDGKAFSDAYQQKYDRTPDQFGAQAYATAQMLFEAFKQAKSTDGDAVRQKLHSLSLTKTPVGALSYDKTGNANIEVKMAEWENGAVVPAG